MRIPDLQYPQRTTVYRKPPRSLIDSLRRAQSCGGLRETSFLLPHDPDSIALGVECIVDFVTKASVSPALIKRIHESAAEALPNALAHGAPDCPISVLVVVFGEPDHRCVIVIAENILPVGTELRLPDPVSCPTVEELCSPQRIHDTHGCGIPLMRERASGLVTLETPGYSLLLTLDFDPDDAG